MTVGVWLYVDTSKRRTKRPHVRGIQSLTEPPLLRTQYDYVTVGAVSPREYDPSLLLESSLGQVSLQAIPMSFEEQSERYSILNYVCALSMGRIGNKSTEEECWIYNDNLAMSGRECLVNSRNRTML